MLQVQRLEKIIETRKRVGVLFEEDLLYERLNAQRNLEFYCQMHKLPRTLVVAGVALSNQEAWYN